MLNKSKYLLLLVFAIIMANNGYAINKSASIDNSLQGNASYKAYTNQLDNLKNQLKAKADEISDIINCYQSNRVYGSSGCKNIYTPETDPTAAVHASKNIAPGACSGNNQVREFNGTSWGCKDIIRTTNSSNGPLTYTYSWVSGSWSTCSPSTCGDQTRSVSCVRNDGLTVSASFCSGARPSSFRSCNVPWNKRYCEPGICVNNGLDGKPVQFCP